MKVSEITIQTSRTRSTRFLRTSRDVSIPDTANKARLITNETKKLLSTGVVGNDQVSWTDVSHHFRGPAASRDAESVFTFCQPTKHDVSSVTVVVITCFNQTFLRSVFLQSAPCQPSFVSTRPSTCHPSLNAFFLDYS